MLALLWTISSPIFSQPTHDEEINYVDSFTNDSITSPIYIYDSKNGSVIDSVMPSPYGRCYILVLIKKMEGDWIQIQHIRHAPCPYDDSLTNGHNKKWLYKTDLFVSIGHDEQTGITIYNSPSKKEPLTIMYGYQIVKIIDTYKNWAKVEYVVESKKIVGWVQRFDQCAARWTACNWE